MSNREKLSDTFHSLMLTADRIEFASDEKITKEVYSNLVLSNITNFVRLHDEIIKAQKLFPKSSNPEIYSILETAYQESKALRNTCSWSPTQSKEVLKQIFNEIVDTMNNIKIILDTGYSSYEEQFSNKSGLST